LKPTIAGSSVTSMIGHVIGLYPAAQCRHLVRGFHAEPEVQELGNVADVLHFVQREIEPSGSCTISVPSST
jgi:hypothetical protein